VANRSNLITIARYDYYRWENCRRGTALIFHESGTLGQTIVDLQQAWADLGFDTSHQLLDNHIEENLEKGSTIFVNGQVYVSNHYDI